MSFNAVLKRGMVIVRKEKACKINRMLYKGLKHLGFYLIYLHNADGPVKFSQLLIHQEVIQNDANGCR
jgi:hypothetical protein